MPDLSIYEKRRPLIAAPYHPATTRADEYAELHCLSNFTFLEGASHADELVIQASKLNYSALAITDKNSLAGVVRAHAAAKDSDLKLIIGAEITLENACDVVLLAKDRSGYAHLSSLISLGRRRAEKGECLLRIDDLNGKSEGLFALVLPGESIEKTAETLSQHRELFGTATYLAAELNYERNEDDKLLMLHRLSAQCAVPLIAAGNVHHHSRRRLALQQVLTAIKHGMTVAELSGELLTNSERHLRSIDTIRAVYAPIPEAIHHCLEVASSCQFSLTQLKYEYPAEITPAKHTPSQYLTLLVYEGAKQLYGNQLPSKIDAQLKHELRLIKELSYETFFLTVFDIVKFARQNGILCQGRGSAANSVVCYCLGITAVDPNIHELLFERFVSQERNEAPDIDVDFEHERREEVLQYIYAKYGRDRAGIAATVITYRPRSAIRDVGKALGISTDRIEALAANHDFRSETHLLPRRCIQSGIDPQSPVGAQLLSLVNEIVGFPRHLSQHVGGMVITKGLLCELVPVENAAMEGRTVVQWDKDDLTELGILKVDCLALGMLTAIRKCFDLIETSSGDAYSILSIPREDCKVYSMISRADTVGVFQVESRAQMSMLPRLKPKTFYDLVIEVAIVRPGPIQGDMVHPYLRRRNGEEEFSFPSQEVEDVLKRTLGVPLFQEQAMQLAVVAAGFSPGAADQLRRAMAAWRRPGLIEQYKKDLIEGMLQKGYTPKFAEQLFNQIRGFGEYGFPESHAASFAKLVYVSAWLKCHYPAAFTAALLNSQPMGFYAPSQLVSDAKSHSVEVLPIDINLSDWDSKLEPTARSDQPAVRLGMRLIKGLQRASANAITDSRADGYNSVSEVSSRSGVSATVLERFAKAGVFDTLHQDRQAALWTSMETPIRDTELALFGEEEAESSQENRLPRLSAVQKVIADYHATGLSLHGHPVEALRPMLTEQSVITANCLVEAASGQHVKVAGLVLMRQRPGTAKGTTFITLEDETGSVNLIIPLRTWKEYEHVARRSQVLLAAGKLERAETVIHVIADKLTDLAGSLPTIGYHSRDFH